MSEILYSQIKAFLNELKPGANGDSFPSVVLIFGDEMLYKTALQTLLDALIPPEKQAVCYEPMDGIPENVYLAIENLNTYSFFSDRKVVGFLDTRIFYAKKNAADILEKTKEACAEKDFKAAARNFFSLLSLTGLSFDDVRNKSYAGLNIDMDAIGDTAWLDALVDYCAENPPSSKESDGSDPLQALQSAIEKGFPKNHHLILTTDLIDKRKGLYKLIAEKGLTVDCSVPKGDSWADRQAQSTLLAEQLKVMLAPTGKSLDKAAFQKLVEMTGFDLRMFSGNLEKLIQYAGDRRTIDEADVESVLTRTRQDPIYEMTNAVTDRNYDAAAFYLKSLLARGFFPLQIIAGIVNQVRRLLIVKDFLESAGGKFWQPGLTFDQFKKQFNPTILPALQAHDAVLIEQLGEWEAQLHPTSASDPPPVEKKKKKGAVTEKKAAAPTTDLLLVKQSPNPYPLFLTMQKADRFTSAELIDAIIGMDEANLSLKSSKLPAELILDNMIRKICGINCQ
jgi:DNA polymerase-3 subunit delta